MKENIVPMSQEEATQIVKMLRPVQYNWKKTKHPDIGLIAQHVRDIAPNVVLEGMDELLRVDYNKISVYVLAALQQVIQRVERLECTRMHRYSRAHRFSPFMPKKHSRTTQTDPTVLHM